MPVIALIPTKNPLTYDLAAGVSGAGRWRYKDIEPKSVQQDVCLKKSVCNDCVIVWLLIVGRLRVVYAKKIVFISGRV
jgi:hypothetical protein